MRLVGRRPDERRPEDRLHLLEHAEKLSHRVGILYQGRLAMAGTLDELRRDLPENSSLEEIYFQVTRQAPAEAAEEAGRAHS